MNRLDGHPPKICCSVSALALTPSAICIWAFGSPSCGAGGWLMRYGLVRSPRLPQTTISPSSGRTAPHRSGTTEAVLSVAAGFAAWAMMRKSKVKLRSAPQLAVGSNRQKCNVRSPAKAGIKVTGAGACEVQRALTRYISLSARSMTACGLSPGSIMPTPTATLKLTHLPSTQNCEPTTVSTMRKAMCHARCSSA